MRRALLTLALLGMGAGTAAAQPAKKLLIAIYAPNAPFASGTDQFTFIQRLAAQITSAAGAPAEGKSFARASDFDAAIKAKQVDFAVIDGVYLAQRGVPYSVLAAGTTGGDTAPKWGLFTTAPSIADLQGKKLSIASTGPRDEDFIGNALFDGELAVKKFFAPGLNRAPNVASAVEAVKLNKADAVFAPDSESKGMKSVFDAGRIPNAAFCEVGSHDAALVGKVKAAVLSHGVQAAIDGWKASDAGPYKALAGRMGARTKRPVMAEPEVVKIDVDMLVPPVIEPQLPDLKNQYWNP